MCGHSLCVQRSRQWHILTVGWQSRRSAGFADVSHPSAEQNNARKAAHTGKREGAGRKNFEAARGRDVSHELSVRRRADGRLPPQREEGAAGKVKSVSLYCFGAGVAAPPQSKPRGLLSAPRGQTNVGYRRDGRHALEEGGGRRTAAVVISFPAAPPASHARRARHSPRTCSK